MLVVKVRSKYLTIFRRHFLVHWASQYGYYLCFASDCLVDEWKLHFNAMLVLIIVNIQHKEPFLLLKLVHNLNVDL